MEMLPSKKDREDRIAELRAEIARLENNSKLRISCRMSDSDSILVRKDKPYVILDVTGDSIYLDELDVRNLIKFLEGGV